MQPKNDIISEWIAFEGRKMKLDEKRKINNQEAMNPANTTLEKSQTAKMQSNNCIHIRYK